MTKREYVACVETKERGSRQWEMMLFSLHPRRRLAPFETSRAAAEDAQPGPWIDCKGGGGGGNGAGDKRGGRGGWNDVFFASSRWTTVLNNKGVESCFGVVGTCPWLLRASSF